MELFEYLVTLLTGMVIGAFIAAIIMFRSFYKNQVDFFQHIDSQLEKFFNNRPKLPTKMEVFQTSSLEEFQAEIHKIIGRQTGKPVDGWIDGRSRDWYIAKLNSKNIKFDPDSSIKELKKIYDLMIGDDDEI